LNPTFEIGAAVGIGEQDALVVNVARPIEPPDPAAGSPQSLRD